MKSWMGIGRKLIPVIVFLLTAGGLASADVVVLENGDRFTGKIVKVEGAVLEMETDFAGKIGLAILSVVEFSTEGIHEVHLTSGVIVQGELTLLEGKRLQIGSQRDPSALVVDWEQVEGINPPSAKAVWGGNVTLGGTMKSGNTESRNASLAANAVRSTERDRISLKIRYDYGEEDDVRTAESTYGATKYDFFLSDRIYTFLSLELLKDAFKDLNLRTVVGPGIGWQALKDEVKALSLEVGISYFNEDRESDTDESRLSGRLGADLRYRFLGSLEFGDSLLVYPSFEDGGEYQLRNEASVATSLGADWSLNLTNILEHDSEPPEGVEEDDLTWVLGLQYSF